MSESLLQGLETCWGQVRGDRLIDLPLEHHNGGSLQVHIICVLAQQVNTYLLRSLPAGNRLRLACWQPQLGHVIAYSSHMPLDWLCKVIHAVLALRCCIIETAAITHWGLRYFQIRYSLTSLLEKRCLAHILHKHRSDWFFVIAQLDLWTNKPIDVFVHCCLIIVTNNTILGIWVKFCHIAPIDCLRYCWIVTLVEETITAVKATHSLVLVIIQYRSVVVGHYSPRQSLRIWICPCIDSLWST